MSQPKRYSFWPQIVHLPNGSGVKAEVHFKIEEDGLFVAHQDYAALAAEKEAETRATFDAIRTITQLRDENERLRSSQLSLDKWIACEQIHFETADNLREKLYQASLEVERLRKAGDAMYRYVGKSPQHSIQMDKHDKSKRDWLAAKEGRDAK